MHPLRTIYERELDKLNVDRRNAISKLVDQYIHLLQKEESVLTKEGKIYEPLEVRSFRMELERNELRGVGDLARPTRKSTNEIIIHKDVALLPQEDQEIIKGLKFYNPEASPLDTRHWTYIKGRIEVINSSPRNTIANKLQIEMRMLGRNKDKDKDKEWSVIRCVKGFGITDKGSQTIGISFGEQNRLFEKLYADKKIKLQDTYTVVRYLGIVIFESLGKNQSSFPENWWKDDSLVWNK